jgi:phosphoribosylanthranilate isomerase
VGVRVKICGITNLDDALAAIDFGADALGFVFFPSSPRYISYLDASEIIRRLPPFINTVGVFVNENPAQIIETISVTGINVVQLHSEGPSQMPPLPCPVIKAIRVKSLDSLDPLINIKDVVSAFLLDTYTPDVFGGTGQIFNWEIAVEAKQFGRIILAGGLTPDNISEAVRHVKPYAVDVSSGVEAEKGKKDHKKLKLFIDQAKRT